jgi:hypothetical protein
MPANAFCRRTGVPLGTVTGWGQAATDRDGVRGIGACPQPLDNPPPADAARAPVKRVAHTDPRAYDAGDGDGMGTSLHGRGRTSGIGACPQPLDNPPTAGGGSGAGEAGCPHRPQRFLLDPRSRSGRSAATRAAAGLRTARSGSGPTWGAPVGPASRAPPTAVKIEFTAVAESGEHRWLVPGERPRVVVRRAAATCFPSARSRSTSWYRRPRGPLRTSARTSRSANNPPPPSDTRSRGPVSLLRPLSGGEDELGRVLPDRGRGPSVGGGEVRKVLRPLEDTFRG